MDEVGKSTVEIPQDTPADPPPGQADPSTIVVPLAEFEAAVAERDRLISEKIELRDMLTRHQADLDNFRRRTEKEKSETREYAAMEATRSLLPILDDFERALRSAPDDIAQGEYGKGMELIFKRFLETLARLGVERIPAQGARFDPNQHEAIQREERDDVEDQTVVAEYQSGYNFKGRLLRPAMVKVAVKP
jgi:molecular chaperone GrpE